MNYPEVESIVEKPKVFFIATQMRIQSPEKQRSIFQQALTSYEDPKQGPQFDENGRVISRSIVGRSNDFTKMQRKRSQASLQSSPMNLRGSFVTMKHSSFNASLTRKSTSPRNSKQTKPSDHVTLPSNVVYNYMRQSRTRISQNELKLTQKEESLPILERNEMTRDKRILKSFEEQQESWKGVGERLSQKCERVMENTLFWKSQDFRLKRELMEQLPEPISTNIWQNQLRQPHPYVPPAKEVEVIKRSINVGSHSLFSEKFKKLIKSKIKDPIEVGYLQVEGESKLESELSQVKDYVLSQKELEKQTVQEVAPFTLKNWNIKIICNRKSHRVPEVYDQFE